MIGVLIGYRSSGESNSLKVYLLMYGFGDKVNPERKTVDLIEELLVNYIFNLVGTTLIE